MYKINPLRLNEQNSVVVKKSWNQRLFNKYIMPMGGQFSYKGDVEGVQGAQPPS